MVSVRSIVELDWCKEVDGDTIMVCMKNTYSTFLKKKYRGKVAPYKNLRMSDFLEKVAGGKDWGEVFNFEWMYCEKRHCLVHYGMMCRNGRYKSTEFTRIFLK
jgi:hypothetical protein